MGGHRELGGDTNRGNLKRISIHMNVKSAGLVGSKYFVDNTTV